MLFSCNYRPMIRSVYVAATGQHVGKTTSTLGLVSALARAGIKVGYCKPVGQQFLDLGNLKVDKDALLFSKTMDFKLAENIHSPVILGKGATAAYLDAPEKFDYAGRIRYAADYLQQHYEMVVYEGTGHPGVGSVVNLSNADVAKMLGASVIIVVEGGIGNTLDKLYLSLCPFRQLGVPVIGVIVNKVRPDKIDKVRYYLQKKLKEMDLPLLGILPYDKRLSHPIMATIVHAVKGRVLANEQYLDNRVEGFLSGTLLEEEQITQVSNRLLVVSYKRLAEALERIRVITESIQLEYFPLSGIVITGDGVHEKPVVHSSVFEHYTSQYNIPVITTPFDTLGAVIKISRIEVKINTRTPWKVERAIELINEHVDLDVLLH